MTERSVHFQAMKTIGLLGGMSWESTLLYYRAINEQINYRLGGLHSAEVLMSSVDFATVEHLRHQDQWGQIAARLIQEAQRLELAGAELLVLCTNTMHKVAAEIESAIRIPLLHIVDAAAKTIQQRDLVNVGLLGTRPTMEDSFYRDRLLSHQLQPIVPQAEDRALIDRIIYRELCCGNVLEGSRIELLRIISQLRKNGVDCILLGCTELCLLIEQTHTHVPLFDTTTIHVQQAVSTALEHSHNRWPM